MQTFLPYPNISLSAHVLDPRRLGKQRLECVQILRTLASGKTAGWSRHPAVVMWRDHEPYLCSYTDAVIREWSARGYVNNMSSPVTHEGLEACRLPVGWVTDDPEPPHWLGSEPFHSSHRAALLAKEPRWYSQFCWDETPVVDYFWPTQQLEERTA